jgi:hypothetical protein
VVIGYRGRGKKSPAREPTTALVRRSIAQVVIADASQGVARSTGYQPTPRRNSRAGLLDGAPANREPDLVEWFALSLGSTGPAALRVHAR